MGPSKEARSKNEYMRKWRRNSKTDKKLSTTTERQASNEGIGKTEQ